MHDILLWRNAQIYEKSYIFDLKTRQLVLCRKLPRRQYTDMARIYSNLTELVGHTPLLHLERLSKAMDIDESTRILAKLEYLNPGGSVKDRAALGMSEVSDAIIIAVSEETGGISLAHDSVIKRNIDPKQLQQSIHQLMYINRKRRVEKEQTEA